MVYFQQLLMEYYCKQIKPLPFGYKENKLTVQYLYSTVYHATMLMAGYGWQMCTVYHSNCSCSITSQHNVRRASGYHCLQMASEACVVVALRRRGSWFLLMGSRLCCGRRMHCKKSCVLSTPNMVCYAGIRGHTNNRVSSTPLIGVWPSHLG